MSSGKSERSSQATRTVHAHGAADRQERCTSKIPRFPSIFTDFLSFEQGSLDFGPALPRAHEFLCTTSIPAAIASC